MDGHSPDAREGLYNEADCPIDRQTHPNGEQRNRGLFR